ncbi:MAG: signal peptidase II [Brachybacterium sp.]|nr:signal peptidase II [Brachybacterium sp.]
MLAVIDQITKNWAEANLPLLEPQPFLGEFLQLTLLYNTGAAWGMGSEITPVVTCLQIAIVIGVIIFALKAVRSPWYTVALGLILGGALGNIHDRLLRDPSPFHGAVVDFLELPNWPVFNIADMGVVGGAILIVVLGLFGVAADPAADAAEPDPAQSPSSTPEEQR